MDEALDAAAETFLRLGYAGASIHDLASAMGVNKPSLYAAYGDKEELFLAALKRRASRVGEELMAAFDGANCLDASVKAVLAKAIALYLPGQGAAGCVVLSAALPSVEAVPRAAEWSVRFFRAGDASLARRIARKMGHKGAPAERHEQLGKLLFAAIRDIATRARVGQSPAELEAAARAAHAAIGALARSGVESSTP